MAPHHEADRTVAHAGSDRSGQATGVEASLAAAFRDVTLKLDAPGVGGSERKRLLQRQAELGDLRDERALRARRRLGARQGGI